MEQLRVEAVTAKMETLAGYDALRHDLTTAVANLAVVLQPDFGSSGNLTQLQDVDISFGAVKDLMVNLQSRALEVQLQHQVLSQLANPSVYSREHSITNASDGTFEWMFDANAEIPSQRPMPHHFGLPTHQTQVGRPWADGNHETEALRNYVQALFGWWLAAGSHIFHFSGKAGSGKSTLMKHLWRHPLTEEGLQAWAYPKQLVMGRFYFWAASKDAGLTTLGGLYRSILFEVLRQCPELIPRVFPRQWGLLGGRGNHLGMFRLTGREMFGESDIIEAFDLLIKTSTTDNRRFCFFIDGLDEFAGDFLAHRDLVERLSRWVESSHVKLCTSSRPEPEKLEILSKPPSCLVSLHEMTRNDIQRFCQTMFEKDRNADYIKDRRPELIHEIVERANGVFLWAFLIVRLLLESVARKDSMDILFEKLISVPLELGDLLFQRLLKPLNPVDERRRRRMLYFALKATEEPSVHAFAWLDDICRPGFPYSLDILSWSDDQVKSHAQKASALVPHLTKGLLETATVSTNYRLRFIDPCHHVDCQFLGEVRLSSPYPSVRFLHRSAFDFLAEPERSAELRKAFTFPVTFEVIEFRLRVADLLILQRMSHSPRDINLMSLVYARRHCNIHPAELEQLFRVMGNIKSRFVRPYGILQDSRSHGTLSHLAAFCGQSKYIAHHAERLSSSLSVETNILLSAFLAGTVTTKASMISSLLRSGASATKFVRIWTGTGPMFESEDMLPVWIVIALHLVNFVLSGYSRASVEEAADTMRAFKLILQAAPTGVADECFVQLRYRSDGSKYYCPLRHFTKTPDYIDELAEDDGAGSDHHDVVDLSGPEYELHLPLGAKEDVNYSGNVVDGRIIPWSEIWNYGWERDMCRGSVLEVVALEWQDVRVQSGTYWRVF